MGYVASMLGEGHTLRGARGDLLLYLLANLLLWVDKENRCEGTRGRRLDNGGRDPRLRGTRLVRGRQIVNHRRLHRVHGVWRVRHGMLRQHRVHHVVVRVWHQVFPLCTNASLRGDDGVDLRACLHRCGVYKINGRRRGRSGTSLLWG